MIAVPSVQAQVPEPPPLSVEEAVRLGIEHSPQITAAQNRLNAASAGLRGARAPYNPVLEAAPGVGFTNGNALLSQRFDIGGRRSAEAQVATGERNAAQADVERTRLQVAGEVRLAYYEVVRARSGEAAVAESVEITRQLREVVRKRVEIGEAPAVQAARAGIEVTRAEQDLLRARGDVAARLAVLNRLIGRESNATLVVSSQLEVPPAPAAAAGLVETALRNRPEAAAARSLVEAQRGQVAVARAQRRPDLFAELATDTWSLDRDPFNSRNVGFQARLSFPLLDRGRLRADVDRARAGVQAREAEAEALRRTLTLEVERAAADLAIAREVALNYQQTILPPSLELLKTSRAGFEIGITSFLELLEAQRVLRQTQTEYLNSLAEALRAQIALERALGAVPGLTPAPNERR